MPSITKVTVSVTSEYNPGSTSTTGTGSLSSESWGVISLWDVRPWLPWTSRGLVGSQSWQDYLSRAGVMRSSSAPGFSSATQSPKAWAKRTDTVVVYDRTSGVPVYNAAAHFGVSTPAFSETVTSTAAFDISGSVQQFLDSLVVAGFAYNSNTPVSGFAVQTDELKVYSAYVDVKLDSGVTTRFHPTTATEIDEGTGCGAPTGVSQKSLAIDNDSNTAATVQETNGFFQRIIGWIGFAALWHPAMLILEGWSWGKVICNDPPIGFINTPYTTHTFLTDGGTAPFTWTISAGSLPPGLTLNASTGVVSGTPTFPGTYTFTVQAADASGITSQTVCSIRIRGDAGWLDIWVWRTLTTFTSQAQQILFPPAYERAMRLQLAVEFGRQYPGHDLSKVRKQLAQAVAAIDKENVTNSQAIEDLPEPQE